MLFATIVASAFLVGVYGAIRCVREKATVGIRSVSWGACYHITSALLIAVLAWFPARLVGELHTWLRPIVLRPPQHAASVAPALAGSRPPPRRQPPLEMRLGNAFRPSATSGTARALLSQDLPFANRDFPVYLLRFRVDMFDNETWFVDPNQTRFRTTAKEDHQGWVKLQQPSSTTRTAVVGAESATTSPYPLPLSTVAIRTPTLTRGGGIWLPHPLTKTGVRVDIEWAPNTMITPQEPCRLIPGTAESYLTEIPTGDVAKAIRKLVAEARSDEPLLRIQGEVGALLSALADRCSYSTTVTNSHRESDALLNFLEYDRKGHCALFASAFALSARAMGFPARVCVGYCGGGA